MPRALVVVSARGAERLRTGHPWIYRSDIRSSDAEPGDLVRVESERGRPLGIRILEQRVADCAAVPRHRTMWTTSATLVRDRSRRRSRFATRSGSTARPGAPSMRKPTGCPV